MTSKVSRVRREGGFLGILQPAALIAVLAGAAGSAGLMLHAGRRAPRLLIVLFAIWVLSPFVALAWGNVLSKRWSVRIRATLYGLMLFIALGSLAVYGADALRPPRAQAAFVFVFVPAASWLLTAIVAAAAALIPGRET